MKRFSANEVLLMSKLVRQGSLFEQIDKNKLFEMLEAFAELLEKLQNMPEWAEACDYEDVLRAAGLKE